MSILLTKNVENMGKKKIIRIIAPVDFSFIWHIKFRETYQNESSSGIKFIIDLVNTTTLSISALGMILLLKDHTDLIKGELTLINPNFKQPFNLLKIANFDMKLRIVFDEEPKITYKHDEQILNNIPQSVIFQHEHCL